MSATMAISYPPLGLTLLFAALIFIWLLATLRQRYRTAGLSALANALKLRIFPRDPLNIPQRYEQLFLFRHGHARRARNVMIGHGRSRPLRAFDYLYETGLGLDRRTQRFSVVVTQTDSRSPSLLAHPAQPNLRLFNLTGLRQIDLPRIESEHNYAVFCEEKDFARENMPSSVVAKLQQNNNAVLETHQGLLALYVPRKLKPAQYRQLIDLAGELTEQLAAGND